MKTFKTTGRYVVVYPKPLREAVIAAIEEWKQFCALPLEEKKKTPYSNNAAGVGYEFKDGSGPGGDFKENMDVTTGPFIDLIRATTLEFARKCESEFGLTGFEEEVSRSTFFVRFIHYFGDRELGVETATAHVDQSAFTLHLYDSALRSRSV
jgi:isopenicillin N synthase-like dioxygenase